VTGGERRDIISRRGNAYHRGEQEGGKKRGAGRRGRKFSSLLRKKRHTENQGRERTEYSKIITKAGLETKGEGGGGKNFDSRRNMHVRARGGGR